MKLGQFSEDSISKARQLTADKMNFSEGDVEVLDFGRCQRPDGTYYGTRGQCRKGKEVGAKEKEPKKTRPSKVEEDAKKALEQMRNGAEYDPPGYDEDAIQNELDDPDNLFEMNSTLSGAAEGFNDVETGLEDMANLQKTIKEEGLSKEEVKEEIARIGEFISEGAQKIDESWLNFQDENWSDAQFDDPAEVMPATAKRLLPAIAEQERAATVYNDFVKKHSKLVEEYGWPERIEFES